MSDKVGMRNEMYRSVGGERGKVLPAQRGGEASPMRRKAKRCRCGEIKVSPMQRNWRLRQYRHQESLRMVHIGIGCESLRMVHWVCAQIGSVLNWQRLWIVANRLGLCLDNCESFWSATVQVVYRWWFRWVIGDGLGVYRWRFRGLSATVIGDGVGSYRLGFFWDWGGLGSFGNEGEGCRLIGRK